MPAGRRPFLPAGTYTEMQSATGTLGVLGTIADFYRISLTGYVRWQQLHVVLSGK